MSKIYKPVAELRDRAKGFLNGKYGIAIGAFLILGLLQYTVYSAVSMIETLFEGTASGNTFGAAIAQYAISLVVEFIGAVVVGIISLGNVFFYLKMNCNLIPRVSDLFIGFRENAGRNVAVAFILALPQLLVDIPTVLVSIVYFRLGDAGLMVIMALVTLVTLIIFVVLELGLMPVPYIIHDFPDYTAKEAVAASFKKMRGNKARLFGLLLSFIPYYILGLLTFGIGLLWIYPLVEATKAQFYLDLMNPHTRE